VRYQVQPARSVSLPVIKRQSLNKEEGKLAPVTFAECLDVMTADESIDGYQCPECQRPTTATKSTRFASFPKVLAVQVRRFELVNWVPEKLDVPVQVPLQEQVSLEAYRGQGIQDGEEPLPESQSSTTTTAGAATTATLPVVDEEVVAQLESMGFPRVRCVKAVVKTGNCGAEAAMSWIFEHMDDPDIDVPEPAPQASSVADDVNPEAVEQLSAMGFERSRVERELRMAGGDAERALDRLLSIPDDEEATAPVAASAVEAENNNGLQDAAPSSSAFELTGFVSHKGSSVHCGHYIANVRHGSGSHSKWFMFNDAKVVAQDDNLEQLAAEQAYVYFLTRIE
ncbi:ubiquitin C-terminal hydrolase Ubp14, partial [Coemansia aciculifera]